MPQGSSTSPQQAAAAAACGALHRAYRDLRLYPANHPMARQSIDGLAVTIARYVEDWGALILEVRENTLLADGEIVYQHDTSRDNLAFLMFRDGMRTLTLHSGAEVAEIETLVDCLAHADDLADMEQDLVTALWERDFGHIDYQVVDPFLAGEVLGEGMVDTLRETVLRRLDATTSPASPAGSPGSTQFDRVEPKRIESAGLQLTPQEVQYGERAVEGLASVLEDFAEVLLEITTSPVVTGDDAVTQSLTAVVAAFLDVDDIGGASLVLARLRDLETDGLCRPDLFGVVAGGAITPQHIRRLVQTEGQAPADGLRNVEAFLKPLTRWIFSPLLEILAETDDRAVRKTVLGLLEEAGGVPWPDLEVFLRDPRWYVVRNAVQLAAAAGHRELIVNAPRLLRHPEVQVRREVVRALERLGGQEAARSLTLALTDSDSSVRTLAARAVVRECGAETEAALLAHIEGRNFASLPPEEIEAFFGAYAELAQERALPLLERSWKRRMLSSRPAPFRVAAISAAGRIRGPAARSALHEAAKSGDSQIKRAAMQAALNQSTLAPRSGS